MPKLSPEALAQIARTGAPPPLPVPPPAEDASSSAVPPRPTGPRPQPAASTTSQPETPKSPAAVKARRTKGRGRETPRISLDLPASLHMQFARALLDERLEIGRAIPMTEVLRELVSFWLSDEGLRQRVREALVSDDGEEIKKE